MSPILFRLRDEDLEEEGNPFRQPVSVQFQSENLLYPERVTSVITTSLTGDQVHPQRVACQPPQNLTIKQTNHLCSPLFTQKTYKTNMQMCALLH